MDGGTDVMKSCLCSPFCIVFFHPHMLLMLSEFFYSILTQFFFSVFLMLDVQ